MTTAETNNERATVEEFAAEVNACLRNGREAGVPTEVIVELMFGAAITVAMHEGLDAHSVGLLFREAGMRARKALVVLEHSKEAAE